MKEVLFGILIMVVLGSSIMMIGVSSCEQQQKVEQKPQEPIELSKDNENYYYNVIEYTYEGCEYIKVGYGKSIWGSHKGNCKNPIHNK
jgi:predicted phage tail protein